MDLGDMYISLGYVDRQIRRDREEEAAAAAALDASAEGRGRSEEDDEEQEWWDSDRGVSGAMSRVYNVQVCFLVCLFVCVFVAVVCGRDVGGVSRFKEEDHGLGAFVPAEGFGRARLSRADWQK